MQQHCHPHCHLLSWTSWAEMGGVPEFPCHLHQPQLGLDASLPSVSSFSLFFLSSALAWILGLGTGQPVVHVLLEAGNKRISYIMRKIK